MKNWMITSFLAAMIAVSGCNIFAPPDNPAAVLEGTWTLVFDEPGDLEGTDIELTFDANGELVEILATGPQGGTASLDVDAATTSEVDGDQVTITVPVAGGTRIFEGTLSADENTIDGSLSAELELPSGDLEVTLPGNDLTLTRQAS